LACGRLAKLTAKYIPFLDDTLMICSNCSTPNAIWLELENEAGLVSEIILIVVACGDVVNEARQNNDWWGD